MRNWLEMKPSDFDLSFFCADRDCETICGYCKDLRDTENGVGIKLPSGGEPARRTTQITGGQQI